MRVMPRSGDWITAGWAALVAPVTVSLHELGHYAVARWDGIPVIFGPASVTPAPGAETLSPSIPGLGEAMGPAVTLALTFGAIALIRRFGPARPLVAAALLAPGRMIVIYAFLLFAAFQAIRGGPQPRPNFDEYNALSSLGIAPVPVLIVIAILLPIAWWLAIRAVPTGARRRTVIAILAGGSAGLFLWVRLLGPALLG